MTPGGNEKATGAHDASDPEQLCRRLALRGFDAGRYRLGEELGHGGMGDVVLVHDAFLDRALAMKIARHSVSGGAGVDRRTGRFLDEARITSQLDHPGIVPVHELGVEAEGRPYYTMKLVKGRNLEQLLENPGDWGLARMVGVLLKVCEAMAYAHAKGVIHRDLKPANIMLGRFGEVYVMDWGLARVIGQGTDEGVAEELHTQEVGGSLRTPESSLVTGEGVALGTPGYMAPEQARGRLAELGPATDVYAMGAMLYRVLAGHAPYAPDRGSKPAKPPHELVLMGPPRSLAAAAPGAPEELVSICERAMARRASERFADMGRFADQLRAWLENRVVSVHRRGPWIEMVKWVGRNRLEAALLVLLLAVLAASGWIIARSEGRRRGEVERRLLLEQRELQASRAEQLLDRAELLWPAQTGVVPAIDAWLDQARELLAASADVRDELAALRVMGVPEEHWPPRDPMQIRRKRRNLNVMRDVLSSYRERLQAGDEGPVMTRVMSTSVEVLTPREPQLAAELAAYDERQRRARPYHFEQPRDEARYATLVRLDEVRRRLAGDGGVLAQMEQRREQARSLDQLSGARLDEWRQAIASIADRQACPLYKGQSIHPQRGLLPLRRNPQTGLWEFLHELSGAAPVLDLQGHWVLSPESGVVLVLVPGGGEWIGAQPYEADAPAYDSNAQEQERPPREVDLSWYFLAAHELTQAQWARLSGTWPARHAVGDWERHAALVDMPLPATAPVEWVSWKESVDALKHWGLTLPTEAQWIHAARALRDSPYSWCLTSELQTPVEDLYRDVIATRLNSGLEAEVAMAGRSDLALLSDGFLREAPVGSYPPNPFGFHDLAGNVAEWCLDVYASDLGDEQLVSVQPGTGKLRPLELHDNTWKGGSYKLVALQEARVAARHGLGPDGRAEDLGLRVARAVER